MSELEKAVVTCLVREWEWIEAQKALLIAVWAAGIEIGLNNNEEDK